MNYYSKRIEKFRKSMNCDVAVLISEKYNSNVYYFTGFKGIGFLLIFKNKKPVFLTTALDVSRIHNKAIDVIVLKKSLKDYFTELISTNKRIGIDILNLSASYYLSIKKALKPKKLIDISHELVDQRAFKDEYEVKQLQKACTETCDILALCFKNMKKFTTEGDIKNFLETETKRRGYDVGYDTIVASAANGANPHYCDCNQKLKKGFMVIDFGVMVDGYHADVSRTIYLGSPSIKEVEEYEKVLAVQESCIEMLQEGSTFADAHNFAVKELGNAYVHSLGHGIGLDIHEQPSLNGKSTYKPQNTMTF
ncbi:MAG TPA: Xaa-Pro peptidase family protein, partial [Candidatus Nanoarchaeia archaeon]|nr:Xaa-Pro peptidase family protein [Candidatus Nanoarchaeia archaeon]